MSRMTDPRKFVLTALLAALSACVTPREEPAAEALPQPIVLGSAGSHPVVFHKALFRIPVGTPLSVTRMHGRVVDEKNWEAATRDTTAFNVSATDELRRLGYDVKDASDAVFTPGSTIEARFQIAAIVHALRIANVVKPDSARVEKGFETVSSEATMEIEFQIFDSVARERVSKTRVSGHALDHGHPGAAMPKAFLAALRAALADPAFVAPLRRDAPPGARGVFAGRPLSMKRCASGSLKLPDDLPRAQAAVVVVVVGAGSGTGTIVSDDGYVLTAAHVVGSQTKAVLRFQSGLELPAQVVRLDPSRDAALLKVPGRGFPCLRTDDRIVDVGTEIWAIGNPVAEELARSVTRGVASGNRTIRDRSFLQTDAAVNPGNSGGPLLDGSGQLRGIVVEKITEAGIEGLGFAVPIADAESALGIAWEESAGPAPGREPEAALPGEADAAGGDAPRD